MIDEIKQTLTTDVAGMASVHIIITKFPDGNTNHMFMAFADSIDNKFNTWNECRDWLQNKNGMRVRSRAEAIQRLKMQLELLEAE